MNEQENNSKEEAASPKQKETETGVNKNNAIGLDENIAGMLCYFFIVGLIFLFVEKENSFIRFHALQSVFLGVALIIISMVLPFIPIIGWMLSIWLPLLVLALVVFLMYQAYNGKYYKLPIIGDITEKQLK
ncbi:DUF4870 domain-containing protein [Psychrobacillus sp. FSL H8-0510]|uniref:DUF4870 domain-containing protein n=1 Tax=Psychrobacillus sp. FSL H8-0510 TaxID=2921394 RepID=UPI0030F58D29